MSNTNHYITPNDELGSSIPDNAKDDFEQDRITARQEARDRRSAVDRPTPIFRRTTTTPEDFPEYKAGMSASDYLNQELDSPITPRYDDAEIASVAGQVAHRVTRYVTDTATWRSWDGTRWHADSLAGQNVLITLMGQSGDTESARIMPYTPETNDAKREKNEQISVREGFAYEFDDVIYDTASDRPYQAVKYAPATNARRLQGIAGLMRSFVSCESTDFDANASILATPAGHIDLATMTQIDAMPESMTTKTTNAVFDPAVDWRESRWGRCLEEVLPDPEVRVYLQTLAGTVLDPSIQLRKLPTFVGGGNNGKSLLLEVFAHTLGDYAVGLDAKVAQGGENEHSTILMPLRGARLGIISETREGKTWNATTLKRLSGGDTLTARAMRQDNVSWRPTHTLFLATNDRPQVPAGQKAFWRRYREITFPHTFVDNPIKESERQIDHDLYATLTTPQECSAVLAWAMEGLIMYREAGTLYEPTAVTQASREAQEEGSGLAVFASEIFEVRPTITERIPAQVVYALWDAYKAQTSVLRYQAPNSVRKIDTLADEIDVTYHKSYGRNRAGFTGMAFTHDGIELARALLNTGNPTTEVREWLESQRRGLLAPDTALG